MKSTTVNEMAEEIAEAFMRAVNGGHCELQAALLARMGREHRTLQGYAIRVMVETLRAIGSDPEWGTDLRNQAAIRWCQALARSEDETLRDGISVW